MSISPYLSENTIQLDVSHSSPYLEGYAWAPIYPGQFVQQNIGTVVDRYQSYLTDTIELKHWGERIIAIENVHEGKTIHDPYEDGERVMMRVLRPGDMVLSRVAGPTVPLFYGSGLTLDQESPPGPGGYLLVWDSLNLAPAVAISQEQDPDLVAGANRWTAVRIM